MDMKSIYNVIWLILLLFGICGLIYSILYNLMHSSKKMYYEKKKNDVVHMKEKRFEGGFADSNGITKVFRLSDDYLEIIQYIDRKEKKQFLRYNQIKEVAYTTDYETLSKEKSSIGRAVAGGILFGGVGAVVGAVSGVGKKEKKIQKEFLIINYTSSSGEDKYLEYSSLVNPLGSNKLFADELKRRINKDIPDEVYL